MAILESCTSCGKLCGFSANDVWLCDDCSGKTELKRKEQEKNANLPESPYEKNEVDKYFYMELSIIFIIGLLMSIGFIYYGFEKYCEYGKKFSILTFIVGNTTCKNT